MASPSGLTRRRWAAVAAVGAIAVGAPGVAAGGPSKDGAAPGAPQPDSCEPQWTVLAGPSATGIGLGFVRSLLMFDEGAGPQLFAAGSFTYAGGIFAPYVARWTGAGWERVGSGLSATVFALAEFDDGSGPAMYAGGTFESAGAVPMKYVACWDGEEWSALPTSEGIVGGGVRALAVYDDGAGPALYAAGAFTTAGGHMANNIARWDGANWTPLEGAGGVGVDGSIYTLTVYDDGRGPALYAGGYFETAAGQPANNIARWDGNEWSTLAGPAGTGVDDRVFAMQVYDDGAGPALYAAGNFREAGGITVNYIARWDGEAWAPLIEGSGIGLGNTAFAMAVYEDVDGPGLYVGGDFAEVGDRTRVQAIGRWNGVSWSGLYGPRARGVSRGSSPVVASMATYDVGGAPPSLIVGGSFEFAGGIIADRIARWHGCPAPGCYADCDESGDLDFFDFLCFQNSFAAGEAQADCDASGELDFFDFLCFQNEFATGCP